MSQHASTKTVLIKWDAADHPTIVLGDEGLERLSKVAAQGLTSLNAYLDDYTGVTLSKQLNDVHGMRQRCLHYKSVAHRDALRCSQFEIVEHVAANAANAMDRLLGCLRLLQMPPNLLPASATPAVMERWQCEMSRILVEYPVLMHNRILVELHHFTNSERVPLATAIAAAEGAELPRLRHGVDPLKLTAFSRHPCVRVALSSVTPNDADGDVQYQGKTLLAGVVSAHPYIPRPRLYASVLELDAVRRAGMSSSPASFLSAKGKTQDDVRANLAVTLLVSLGLKVRGRKVPDPRGFVDALKTSELAKQQWLLNELEWWMHELMASRPGDALPTLRRLADFLVEAQPAGLRTTPGTGPVCGADVVRWLAKAVMDNSTDRAIAIGKAFKVQPRPHDDVAMAVVEALDTLEPGMCASGDAMTVMEWALLADDGHPNVEMWRATMRSYTMGKVIRASATASAANADRDAPPVAARRRRQL